VEPRKCRAVNRSGATCLACGFNFAAVYGELGEGFIHVHHLVPVSQIGKEYVIDPIRDLRPVCPNCHAMLHRNREPLTIENLRDIIESTRQARIGSGGG
jgi:predicted HNH restriction endonuclease